MPHGGESDTICVCVFESPGSAYPPLCHPIDWCIIAWSHMVMTNWVSGVSGSFDVASHTSCITWYQSVYSRTIGYSY